VGSIGGGCIFSCFTNIFANVFVVSHADFDVGVGGLLFHCLEFGDGGCSRLLEVDDRASSSNGLALQFWIITSPSGDESKALHAIGYGRNIRE